jgi:hypothetical protein
MVNLLGKSYHVLLRKSKMKSLWLLKQAGGFLNLLGITQQSGHDQFPLLAFDPVFKPCHVASCERYQS